MGLEKYVRISGRRADVPACISALDLGLVASLWSEAIARAALEIMSCRRPLISSRVGVMPDLLSDNALFPPGDIRAMADLTAHICRHPQKAEDLVQEQNRIMADLDDESFIRKTLQAYTLGRGNPS
jgi:glycosyltransferase involved in cell wall biosynthesis